MRERAGWMLLIGLVSCSEEVVVSGVGEPDLGAVAGSRLRPVVGVTSDEARAFLAWHDSELDVYCTFMPLADGQTRCTPAFEKVVFADAACTEAVWLESACRAGSRYGGLQLTPEPPYCDGEQSYGNHRPYERSEGSAAVNNVYRGHLTPDGLECDPTPVAVAPGETVVRAHPIPYETFVGATRHIAPGSGRLGRVEWRAEDGALEVVAPHDGLLDATCRRHRNFGDGDRCVVSTGQVNASIFADAACSDVIGQLQCGERIAEARGTCTTPSRLFEVGDPIDIVYANANGTCAEGQAASAFRLGAELGPADLPRLYEAEVGAGRVRTRVPVDATGWRVAPNDYPFYDTELGSFCAPVDRMGVHCVPRGLSTSGRYADPSCTQPLHVVSESSCGSLFSWVVVSRTGDATCTVDEVFFPVLGPSAAATVYAENEAGACVVAPLDADEVAYELGPPRTVDSFPTVRIETL